MKNLGKLVVLLVLVAVVGVVYYDKPLLAKVESKFYFSYCDNPIHYRIGTVDPKFGISVDTFSSDVGRATRIWSSAEGKDLFVYDPKGALSVNMIFDERQSLDNQINNIQNQLTQDKSSLSPQMAEYDKLSADFNQKIASFEANVKYWNSQGGAPPDEYNKLKQEQSDLQSQASQLDAMAKSLNLSANQYNAKVSQLNQTVDTFNAALSQKPEEGLFDGKSETISIYLDNNQDEFIHTLTHEFGHALGIDHNQNPKSIMYPFATRTTTLSADDLSALSAVCRQHNVIEIFQQRIQIFLNNQS